MDGEFVELLKEHDLDYAIRALSSSDVKTVEDLQDPDLTETIYAELSNHLTPKEVNRFFEVGTAQLGIPAIPLRLDADHRRRLLQKRCTEEDVRRLEQRGITSLVNLPDEHTLKVWDFSAIKIKKLFAVKDDVSAGVASIQCDEVAGSLVSGRPAGGFPVESRIGSRGPSSIAGAAHRPSIMSLASVSPRLPSASDDRAPSRQWGA